MTVSAFLSHQPRKRFGQNFLHDQVIIGRIIDSIHAGRDDLMVEIGPGMGAITEPLLKEVNRLTVIELDTDLADSLRIRIGANSNDGLTIVKANAMEVDYRALFQQIIGDNPNAAPDKKMRIVGNLPYNISTPLLFHLLSFADVIEDMHFMLQKEVVDRIVAEPNSKDYGRLSVMIQYYCKPEFLFEVPPGAFNPPPKVTSAVFRLTPYSQKPLIAQDENQFASLVSHVFTQRRKTLRNTLKGKLDEEGFARAQVDPMARPENLSLAQFVALADACTAYTG